jgi:SAM-dependent methyltransferase
MPTASPTSNPSLPVTERALGTSGPARPARPAAPARLVKAVDLLDPQAGQRILEIGGGRGVAARLVCDRLRSGRFVGLDRSARAVVAARQLNSHHIARGVAEFHQVALADADPAALGGFDLVFAINVNLFWTGTATRELELISRLLPTRGPLWLFYNYPSTDPGARPDVAERIGSRLEGSGFGWRLLPQQQSGGAFVLRAHGRAASPGR